MLSQSFSHQQTWRERRTEGWQAFKPGSPLMDLDVLHWFERGLVGIDQCIMYLLRGLCKCLDSVTGYASCLRASGWYFLQQAGRPCWRDTRQPDASWSNHPHIQTGLLLSTWYHLGPIFVVLLSLLSVGAIVFWPSVPAFPPLPHLISPFRAPASHSHLLHSLLSPAHAASATY